MEWREEGAVPFEELPHTADVLIRVRAGTLNELFGEAVIALMTLMYGECQDRDVRRSIVLDSDNTGNLLQEFLSEVLYLSEAENIVFCGARVSIDHTRLSASLSGEYFDPATHSGGTEVKGVSYSGLSIREEGDHYEVELLFDV